MHIGLVGLGKMGANMRLRLRERGVEVTGFDPNPEVSDAADLPALVAASDTSGLGSNPVTSTPRSRSRRRMFAPILPRPTRPMCMAPSQLAKRMGTNRYR